ncbi:hypothetical protein BBJ28_00001853 [Nothophytophthora sp. Chile5]|nr:hypothetical protein BBJ28_00001853 [Nothophytophthora sp. Chile5]
MWASSSDADAHTSGAGRRGSGVSVEATDLLFPRRPRRVSASPTSSVSHGSASSRLEQRRRELPPPVGVHASGRNLWSFDAPPSSPAESGESNAAPPGLLGAPKPTTHGVIGSSNGEAGSGARLLWNRPAREEEEREEEALPSYLSYLQPHASTGSVSMAETTAMPLSLPFNGSSATVSASTGQSDDGQVATKSKELARALQDFILDQLQGQQRGGKAHSPVSQSAGAVGAPSSCNCERRVTELERQVETLLAAQAASAEGGGTADALAVEEAAAGSALGDRVSTLEGRQSAFQSQLAQISKVLGVPVGKHGKSSQLKTLVQTLHEEIDAKVQAAAVEVEAACLASATKQTKELLAATISASSSSSRASSASTLSNPSPGERKKQQVGGVEDNASTSDLPFSTVLGALAEEHEASLTRLSVHFDERLRLEGSQRVALEARVHARLAEQEEWLQQLEGEFGGSRFEAPAPSGSSPSMAAVTADLSKLQTQLAELEGASQRQRHEGEQLAARLDKRVSLEVLQTQLGQQKTELKAVQETLAGVQTMAMTTREETRAVARTSQGLKQIVEKLVRDTGSAETLLQQYVSTITHQVASVTRQYVSVRIRDNNRLLDATLRARVPAYVANESESFMLVRPEAKKDGGGDTEGSEGVRDAGGPAGGGFSFVLRDDDEDGIRRVLASQNPS